MHKGERLILALPVAATRYALGLVTVAVTLVVYAVVAPLGLT